MSHVHHCLFIDDNDANNYLTKTIIRIEKLPINPAIYATASQALIYLEQCLCEQTSNLFFPKYIFVDRNMPILNGFSFIEKFEELFAKTKPQTKIYLLATIIDDDDIKKLANYPSVAGCFEKPFSAQIAQKVLCA